MPNGVSRNETLYEIKRMSFDSCKVGVGCTVKLPLFTIGVALKCLVERTR